MLGLSEANKGFGYLPLAKSQHQASSRFIPSNSGFTLKGQPPARLKFISALLAFAGTLLLLSNTLSSDSHSPKSRAQPNSGWIAFDDRLDSPLVKRYINSAPITEQESRFSESCRDEWISRATLCSELRGGLLKKGLLSYNHSFEAVVTWQNGSDPTQIAGRDMAAADLSRGKSGTDPRHFRDHDELRASLRSLMKAYRRYPSAISRILLYTTDLPSDIPHQRIGSIPKWLNLRHASHALTKLEVVFPWQTFKTPSVDSVEEAEKWRSDALPTFQSMAVESQFSNLHVSEYLMYSCDDFFLFGGALSFLSRCGVLPDPLAGGMQIIARATSTRIFLGRHFVCGLSTRRTNRLILVSPPSRLGHRHASDCLVSCVPRIAKGREVIVDKFGLHH